VREQITLTTTVIRHHPQFCRLVTIPNEQVAEWKLKTATVVEGTINGMKLGRRSLKRWDDRQCWWIDLPDTLCKKVGVETGDAVSLAIRRASEELPVELQQLLNSNATASATWQRMTKAQQRMLREEIFSAQSSATRLRRAEKVLC